MKTAVAHVKRVRGIDGFEASIDLDFSVSIHKFVKIRHKDNPLVLPDGSAHGANHCLVILIGGKDVMLANYHEEYNGSVTADVFLTAPASNLPQTSLEGATGTYVDVYAAMIWAAAHRFDAKVVREAVRG
jgi:hypothetical protein